MSGAELAIVLAAVVAGSVVKAITGMGLPIITIPIAALFVDLGDAVVVIALPNVLANAVLAGREIDHRHETRDLPRLAVGGLVGAVLGTLVFVNAPDEPLVAALLVTIAVYITLFFLKPDATPTRSQSRRWSPVVGGAAGAFQGAIGISGPIIGSWIHSYRLPRGAHILSITSLFLAAGAAQFAVLVASGELAGRLTATALACVPVLASIPIGTRLRTGLSTRGFDLAMIGILALSFIALYFRTFW